MAFAIAPAACAQSFWSNAPWDNVVVAERSVEEASELGISAIRIPAPFESRDGWPVDFTEIDAGFAKVVNAAHEAGIRVLVDINLNSAGPPPLRDSAWTQWWSPGWVRANLPGYTPCGDEPVTACTNGIPDFRTEIGEPVDLPPFLAGKWGPERTQAEQRELDEWFTRARYPRTPRHYLVKWMSDLVREFGVDGFFAVDVEHVDVGLWTTLKAEAAQALTEWRTLTGIPTRGTSDFWLTGDVAPDGPIADALFSVGFSALPVWLDARQLNANQLDSLYTARAGMVATAAPQKFTARLRLEEPEFNAEELETLMTTFVLLPGSIALPTTQGSAPASSWADVARFRSKHVAVGAGRHQMISAEPYTFQRSYRNGIDADNIIVVIDAEGRTRVNVSGAFPDDAIVRDAVTGTTAFVSFGYVSFTPGESGLLLLELAE